MGLPIFPATPIVKMKPCLNVFITFIFDFLKANDYFEGYGFSLVGLAV